MFDLNCIKILLIAERIKKYEFLVNLYQNKWKPPSLSELTLMIFNTGLTHLVLEASIYNLSLQKSTLTHKTSTCIH